VNGCKLVKNSLKIQFGFPLFRRNRWWRLSCWVVHGHRLMLFPSLTDQLYKLEIVGRGFATPRGGSDFHACEGLGMVYFLRWRASDQPWENRDDHDDDIIFDLYMLMPVQRGDHRQLFPPDSEKSIPRILPDSETNAVKSRSNSVLYTNNFASEGTDEILGALSQVTSMK
jgi:hypothetical protein